MYRYLFLIELLLVRPPVVLLIIWHLCFPIEMPQLYLPLIISASQGNNQQKIYSRQQKKEEVTNKLWLQTGNTLNQLINCLLL